MIENDSIRLTKKGAFRNTSTHFTIYLFTYRTVLKNKVQYAYNGISSLHICITYS